MKESLEFVLAKSLIACLRSVPELKDAVLDEPWTRDDQAAKLTLAAQACGMAVAAGGRLGVPGGMGECSIPLALYNEACAILRLKLLVRYALAVTAERKAEADAAEARIDAVAKGEIPLAGGPVATAPTYHARPKRWGFSQTGGIM